MMRLIIAFNQFNSTYDNSFRPQLKMILLNYSTFEQNNKQQSQLSQEFYPYFLFIILKQMELIQAQEDLLAYTKQLYYLRANQTEKQWTRDNTAALKIQSKFKMYMKRKEFLRKKAAAIKIETHFRAYYARQQFKHRLAYDNNIKNLKYFAQQAIIIQKIFKGYFVRKYIHNFYLRKSELKALQQKNQQFRDQLQHFGKVQAIEAQQYQQELAKAEFQALAKNLHHLSSTKGIPGVYNSPFSLQKPAVFQKTVEEHLKTAFKQSYKWRPPNHQQILKYSIKTSK